MRAQISAIVSLMDETRERIRLKLPKIYSRDLVEVIFEHPYCKINFLERAGIAKRQTAAHYLRQLEELGILTERETRAGRLLHQHTVDGSVGCFIVRRASDG